MMTVRNKIILLLPRKTTIKTCISHITSGSRPTWQPPVFPAYYSPECEAGMLRVDTKCDNQQTIFSIPGATTEKEMLNMLSHVDLREVCRYAITDHKRHD